MPLKFKDLITVKTEILNQLDGFTNKFKLQLDSKSTYFYDRLKEEIKENESGSISFNILDNNLLKIQKTMIIVPENYNIEYITDNIRLKILYSNNIHLDTYYVINGNNKITGKIINYDSNYDRFKPEIRGGFFSHTHTIPSSFTKKVRFIYNNYTIF